MAAKESYAVLLAMLFSGAAGLVGTFALLNRMVLAGNVISHFALPGLGLAFLLGLDPVIGAASTLLVGTVWVWLIQRKTNLATEATIGVIFAAALAIGALITPSGDLVEALFGGLTGASLTSVLLGVVACALVVGFMLWHKAQLLLMLFSPDLAIVTGVPVTRLQLYFLLVFSLTILMGLRFMGALLTSALIIVPAVTARQVSNRPAVLFMAAPLLGSASVIGGVLLNRFVLKAGTAAPAIVLVSVLFFGLSLLRKRA